MLLKCPRCGAESSAGSACDRCGAELGPRRREGADRESPRFSPSPCVTAIACGGLLVLYFGGTWLVTSLLAGGQNQVVGMILGVVGGLLMLTVGGVGAVAGVYGAGRAVWFRRWGWAAVAAAGVVLSIAPLAAIILAPILFPPR